MFTHYAIITAVLSGLKNAILLRFKTATGVEVFGFATVQVSGKPTGETETFTNGKGETKTVAVTSKDIVLKHKVYLTFSEADGWKVAGTSGKQGNLANVSVKNGKLTEVSIRSSFGRIIDLNADLTSAKNWQDLPEPIAIDAFETAKTPNDLGLSVGLVETASGTGVRRMSALESLKLLSK